MHLISARSLQYTDVARCWKSSLIKARAVFGLSLSFIGEMDAEGFQVGSA